MTVGDHLVLDAVRDWLGRYLLTVTDGDLDLLAIWCAHTHLVQETYTTPRLLIDSPVPGSGKTTALDHLSRLCVRPVQMAAVSSPSMLVRILNDGIRTLLIDEADRSLRPDQQTTPDLLAVLNSGYRRGATRPVNVPSKGAGWVVRDMPTFAPVAMAGNSPSLPDDTRSRTIRILLLPDIHGTVEESDWELIEVDAVALGMSLAAWADANRADVATTRPPMPEGITGRFREKWQPLARVAAVAGGRWPDVVAALAVADRQQADMDREDGMTTTRVHVLLLQHLAEVWPERATFVATTQLVDDLIEHAPDTWGSGSRYGKALTVQRLGRMLANNFKLNSHRLPDGPRTRGYRLADLAAPWERMGVALPRENRTNRPNRSNRPTEQSGSATSSGPAGFQETPQEPAEPQPELPARDEWSYPTCLQPGCSTRLKTAAEQESQFCFTHANPRRSMLRRTHEGGQP